MQGNEHRYNLHLNKKVEETILTGLKVVATVHGVIKIWNRHPAKKMKHAS